MARNTGRRYPQEVWDRFFIEVVEQGIPPTGAVSLDWWYKETGCKISKSTIQNKVNPYSKIANRNRGRQYRKTSLRQIISRRVWEFKNKKLTRNKVKPISESVEATLTRGPEQAFSRSISGRVIRFNIKGTDKAERMENNTFETDDLMQYTSGSQNFNAEDKTVDCLISGKQIDLMNVPWHLDHIDPNKGNTLENCSFTLARYNQMKSNMTRKELIEACKDVLRHNEPEALR